MSQLDATVKTLIISILGPIILLFLFLIIMKRPLKSVKERLFASFMNRMANSINKKLGSEKEDLFSLLWKLRDDKNNVPLKLLEIGPGGGSNFKYYPKGVDYLCVEPNQHFLPHIENNISLFPHIKLKQCISSKGEEMTEVPDEYCDAVVTTLVLCSVDEMHKFLKEVKRVLRPGGIFFYLEHVAAGRSTWTYKLQSFLNPMWRIFGEGCTLNKETWNYIDQAGFDAVKYRRFATRTWIFPLKNLLVGTATK